MRSAFLKVSAVVLVQWAGLAQAGTPEILVDDVANGVQGLAVDQQYAYYGSNDHYDQGRLWRVPVGGGDAQVLWEAPGSKQVANVLLDGGYVYWTSWTTDATSDALGVFRAPLLAPDQAEKLIAADYPQFIVADGAIYWVGQPEGDTPSQLIKHDIASGTDQVLFTAPPDLYNPTSLTTDDQYVYLAYAGLVSDPVDPKGYIYRVRKDGSADAETLAAQVAYPASLLVRGNDLYWLERSEKGKLLHLDIATHEQVRLHGDFFFPETIVPVGQKLYIGGYLMADETHFDDGLYSYDLTTGELATIYAGNEFAFALRHVAVVGDDIFWANDGSNGQVVRLRP